SSSSSAAFITTSSSVPCFLFPPLPRRAAALSVLPALTLPFWRSPRGLRVFRLPREVASASIWPSLLRPRLLATAFEDSFSASGGCTSSSSTGLSSPSAATAPGGAESSCC
ncbi:unnamed protein product, partial [Ectocarpus sp. 12 AP-2014]